MSRKNYEDKEEEEGEEEQEEGEEEGEEEGGKRKKREKKEGQEEDEEKRKKEKREEKTKKMNDVFLLPCIRVFDQENNAGSLGGLLANSRMRMQGSLLSYLHYNTL